MVAYGPLWNVERLCDDAALRQNIPQGAATGSARAKGLGPVFQEALRGLAGSSTIEVTEGLVGGWWLLVFRRDDRFERTLLLSPMEQSGT
jgi:hypothetical protein